MSTQDFETSPENYARPTGILYLLIAVFGGYSMGYAPSVLVAANDAAQTTQNFALMTGTVRLSIIGDMFVFLAELGATAMLYLMFKPTNAALSLVAALARLTMTILMGVNLMLKLSTITLATGTGPLVAFDVAQRDALVMLLVQMHQDGVYIWGLFFGVHLVILGWLVIASRAFPRTLGILLMIGAFGYILEAVTVILIPGASALMMIKNVLLGVAVIGELSFAIWLLARGTRLKFPPLGLAQQVN